MGRSKNYATDEIPVLAMQPFWHKGYNATSIEDLVAATGASRYALYSEFQDKRGLFVSAFQAYVDVVVTPAFAPVEAADAGFAQIRAFFQTQIALAERHGLPGPGCLAANTLVEAAPHNALFAQLVSSHLGRLTAGFYGALSNERRRRRSKRRFDLHQMAFGLTVGAQGLWAISRLVSDANVLRCYAETLVFDIEEKFSR
jgi:TetR/AcrR family transcriptional regulator, transcriptional repressor for nem operon